MVKKTTTKPSITKSSIKKPNTTKKTIAKISKPILSTPKKQLVIKPKKAPTKSIPKKTIVNEKKPKSISKVSPKTAKTKATKPVIKTKQGPVNLSAIPTKKPLTKAKATIKEKITPPKTSEKKPPFAFVFDDGSDEKALKKTDNTGFLPSLTKDQKSATFIAEYLVFAEKVAYPLNALDLHCLKEAAEFFFGLKHELFICIYTDFTNTLRKITELTGLSDRQVFVQMHEAFTYDYSSGTTSADMKRAFTRAFTWEEFKEYLAKADNKKSSKILFNYFKIIPLNPECLK